MKKFLVFLGFVYYPGGGWNDFGSWADGKEEAEANVNAWCEEPYHWGQVVSTSDWEIVYEKESK